MKAILITMLILIGIMVAAQETPILLEVHCKPAGEDTTFLKYEIVYDEDGLKAATLTDAMTSTWFLNHYENDTLRSRITQIGWIYYEHKISQSKIVENYGSIITYSVNSDYEITDYWTHWGVYYAYEYEWASNNLQNIYRNDTIILSSSYDPNYRNPYYGINKTFRVDPWGSHDMPLSIVDGMISDYTLNMVVRDYANDYPTEIDYYSSSNNLLYTEYLIYEVIDGVDDKLHLEPYTVLSVDYYDIMGRKFSKPEKGFYIERKTTNKGIVSTKYFIQ